MRAFSGPECWIGGALLGMLVGLGAGIGASIKNSVVEAKAEKDLKLPQCIRDIREVSDAFKTLYRGVRKPSMEPLEKAVRRFESLINVTQTVVEAKASTVEPSLASTGPQYVASISKYLYQYYNAARVPLIIAAVPGENGGVQLPANLDMKMAHWTILTIAESISETMQLAVETHLRAKYAKHYLPGNGHLARK